MNKNIDIKNPKVAKRYAQALCESAKDKIDNIENDLALVDETIFHNDELKLFFFHPVVSLLDKKKILSDSFQGKIDEITINFLETLLDEGRFKIFDTFYEIFKNEVDKIKKRQQVEIISAIEISSELKEKLNQKLSSKLKKEIIPTYVLSSDIIGGLIIKIEDKVIDLSLKNKLELLKESI